MLSEPRWLALEAKYLDRAVTFYETVLGLDVRARSEDAARLAVGDTDLVLRTPGAVPRGGLHTHFALSTPADEYDAWYERLDERFDLTEREFGDRSSLYFYDVIGNCVEIGQRDAAGTGITGLFEVVLEVEDRDCARAFYTDLGFDVVDEGEERRRTRLTTGAFDLELWEPQLGIADGRGGVHVDLGVAADDPDSAADAVADRACCVERTEDGMQIRDPEGHYVTLT